MPPAHAGARVLLVAKFNPRYHRTGGAIRDALTGLGCEVACVEERTRGLDALLRRSLPARIERALRRHRPDLVLVFKGATLEPEAIEALRRHSGARWVNWFPDSPHLLDLSLRIGRAYDCCFIFDSSMVERHRALGRRAEYLAEGCDPAYHRSLADPRQPQHQLAFVGSPEPLRDEALQGLRDFDLGIWGPGRPAGPLYGDDFVRAFSNAKVALNIHQFFGEPPDRGWYGTGANRRTFELAAIGTAQLCDAKADVTRHFTEDAEIVLYRTAAELRAKAELMLSQPTWREELRGRAHARALREHTWRHRLSALLGVALR